MKQWVELIDHLAWPITSLAILYILRSPLLAILSSIKTRISDPRTNVVIGAEGVKLESQLNAVASLVELLQINQDQLKALVFPVARRVADNGLASMERAEPRSRDIPPELLKLADEYLQIFIPDWRSRVNTKNQYMQAMTNLVISKNISKDALLDSGHEGLIAAMVGAIHTFPEPGDLERLLKASETVRLRHVQYRIVLAFTALIEKGLVTSADLVAFGKCWLDSYRGPIRHS